MNLLEYTANTSLLQIPSFALEAGECAKHARASRCDRLLEGGLDRLG
jgi:hypothetical protein